MYRRVIERWSYQRELMNSGKTHLLNIDRNLEKIIDKAYQNGVAGFDTSSAYGGSEIALGNVLSKRERKTYFIISKISNFDQKMIGARKALENSLKNLKTDYVDLYLIHWPQPDTYMNIWNEMIKLYEEGKCRAIGVCNCKEHHIEDIIQQTGFKPMVNEIEVHPLLTEKNICNYCIDNNIQIMAYTSTARMDSRLIESPRIVQLCKKYDKSAAQIILRWHIQQNRIPIFNTSNSKHLMDNIKNMNFKLSKEDLLIIDGMNINSRLRYDSDNCDYDIL